MDFCSDLREQSQENLDLQSYRTKVCYEFGEMYGQAKNACMSLQITKIGEEPEISPAK